MARFITKLNLELLLGHPVLIETQINFTTPKEKSANYMFPNTSNSVEYNLLEFIIVSIQIQNIRTYHKQPIILSVHLLTLRPWKWIYK